MYNFKDERVITNLNELVHSKKRFVVLTFDDGPSKYLSEILAILAREEAVAMFFWQSRLLYDARPWRQTIEHGHLIGTHSHKHPNLVQLDYDQQKQELTTSKRVIEQIIKQPVRYFRPPFGQYNEHTIALAAKLDLITVMWEIASFDWILKDDPYQIVDNVINNIQDGSIILLHELEQTVQVLPTLIRRIKEEGYSLTTL